jgi:hypothetical protein
MDFFFYFLFSGERCFIFDLLLAGNLFFNENGVEKNGVCPL